MLFCIAEDALRRGITHLVNSGLTDLIAGPRGHAPPIHIFYVDDLLVFCKVNKKSLQNLMSLFHSYGQASSQLLSHEKCRFYAPNMSPPRCASISSTVGFSQGQLPFIHLGVPIFRGKPRRIYCQGIANKVVNKLASWKGGLLSIMGRVKFVQSIIHGIVLYTFQAYAVLSI